MKKEKRALRQLDNRLLSRLPQSELEVLLDNLEVVSLGFAEVLYEANSLIDYVYFPSRAVVSATTVMNDGRQIEVATVGNEGMTGLTALVGAYTSPTRVLVQIPGEAFRLEARILRKLAAQDGSLRRLLHIYLHAFLTQVSFSVACNGLHTLQRRCCRWLLITHDRVASDKLSLTHEFLAVMLGVRRASISEVLKPLQRKKLIRSGRGVIEILDRDGLEAVCCECYHRVKDEFDRLLDSPVG
jgi:CRP-like cAMP-binding protein